jgi:hypothetical protein
MASGLLKVVNLARRPHYYFKLLLRALSQAYWTAEGIQLVM